MLFIAISTFALLAAPVARAICPEGSIGVGLSELCGITEGDPSYQQSCGGTFGALFENDCTFIAMNNDGLGDWCAGGYTDGASVSCVGGYQSQPYFIVTSGGYFGNCVSTVDNCDDTNGFASEYNPISWCCTNSNG